MRRPRIGGIAGDGGKVKVGMLGHWEIIVLLVVVLLIFGPTQLPKLARGIGKSIQSFKSGMGDAEASGRPKDAGKLADGDASGEEKRIAEGEKGEE